MRFKILTLFTLATLFISCKKDKSTLPPVINVSVQLADNSAVNNAVISLLDANHATVATATSGSDGKIAFTATANNTYYLYNNLADSKIIADPDATYFITGTFTSQQQINNSPVQTPAAKIGDNVYLDINGDGAINYYDLVKKVTAPAAGSSTNVKLIMEAH